MTKTAAGTAFRVLAAIVLMAAVASCGVDAGSQRPGGSSGRTPTPTVARTGIADRALKDLGEQSLALVETAFATGSAVLIDDGYLVTNAHVVDPFDAVDLRFADGGFEHDVPVAGVDLTADLAVLGPIESSRTVLSHGDPEQLASGEAVHLVGFPGEQDDPHVVVEDGTYARHQFPEGWDLDYLQANIDIGEGQSGGAFVDDRGRLLGISGLEASEGVALSLSVDDVEDIAKGLKHGSAEGPAGDWTPIPDEQGDEAHTIGVEGPQDVHVFLVSGAAYREDLTISVSDPSARVAVMEPGYYPVAANDAAMAAGQAGDGVWSFNVGTEDDVEVMKPDGDGNLGIDVDAGSDLLVLVGSDRAVPALDVRTAPGSVEVDAFPKGRSVAVGEEVVGTVGYLDSVDRYTLDLKAGDEVIIDGSSASGDLAFILAEPGQPWGEAPLYDGIEDDEVGEGMLEADPYGSVVAKHDGRYSLIVFAADDTSTTYRIATRPG